MKYFLSLLVTFVLLIISSTRAKIPDYIKVCKRNDPNINECVKESIIGLRQKLTEGIPELDVQSIDPLRLDKAGLNLGPGFKADVRDLVLNGARNFDLQDLDVNTKTNVCSFTVLMTEMSATATYEIDAKIGTIPLKGSGPLKITGKLIRGRGTLRGKNIMKAGKTYNWFPSMTLKFDVGDYSVKLENLFDGDPTIEQATNKLLNEQKPEVLESFLPLIEKAVTEYILKAANNIAKHFTWDELFPES